MRVLTDLQRTKDEIRAVAADLAAMISDAPDPNKRLPRSEWTVAETAAHLAIAQKGMGQIAVGEIENPYRSAGVADFAEINARYLRMFSDRDTRGLAPRIVEHTEEFLDKLGRLPESERVPSPMGEMDVACVHVYNLAHLLMHGHPLALALSKNSPVTRDRALLVVPFLTAVAPKVFDAQAAPNLSACMEVRMRGGPRFTIVFGDGECRVETNSLDRVDCYISADPSAFFLVAAGVVSQWGPIAKGRMTAWGRKPWLSLKLKTVLPNP